MPKINLRGVTVNFPFTPYECQNDYMNKVIECLQNKVNGILESPTGTGKTLCLLCATLAWREYFKDTISARKISERLKGGELFPDTPLSSWGTAAVDGDPPTYYTETPKIIYASRTHSQLSQVVTELKNTSYRPKVCVLGSREQLCIHPEVMRQESNHIKVHMCRAKISSRTCVFYNNLEEKSTDKEIVNSIMDVEDLVKAGNKHRVCPYYLARSLKQQADIIFMPYNYLLDPKSRRAHNIELKGAVIIFDEAHNVERTCEESTSFDLTPYDLASSIDTVDKLLAEQAKEPCKGDPGANDWNSESLNSSLKMDITTIAKIKQILLDLEAVIDSYEVLSDKGITKPGSFIFEIFQKAHVTLKTKSGISEALEQITGYLAGRQGIFLNTSGLQKLTDMIQLVFCNEPQEGNSATHMQSNTGHFKVHIHQDTSNHKQKQQADVWASSKKQGNILSYWCFSPGFSMLDLVRQGVRNIILTSGTLSPLSSFTSEMQIPFPVCLENGHVIQRDQIFVSVVDRGPDGVRLSSAFDQRFVPENMASLGNTVANLGRVVPDGLLVFFPSYPLMDKTLEFWKTNGHADRIENMKPMFVEAKGKRNFMDAIEGYYNKVNDAKSKGGSFFAVCRGKASEGLDFADSFGRGVIITGLPFPPKMDPRVILKMQFLDEMSRKKVPGVKYLSGIEWYRQQASRAVNQAIGRVIRHKEDYGAVFLCDQRFKNSDVQAQLPSWLKPYVRKYDNFGNLVRDVTQFFRVAKKLRPPIEKAATESCDATGFLQSPSSCLRSCTSSQHSVAQKAKALDSHTPTLKRRRLNEHNEPNCMAGLCMEYTTEMHVTPRPVGLMDALDHSDQQNGEENCALVGKEKVTSLSTPSLQHDKHMDEAFRSGKRKIKVVQEQRTNSPALSGEGNMAEKAKCFLVEVKKTMSQVSFEKIMQALQTYKRTDHLRALLTEAADLLTGDANTHNLFRGLYQFIRPHHKKIFDEKCQELTGQGCGYKPDHSLSKEEKGAMMWQTADSKHPGVCMTVGSSSVDSSCSQLNTSLQLNKGGGHLGNHAVSQQHLPTTGQTDPKSEVHAVFLADVKAAIGVEKSSRLFQVIRSYKKEGDYKSLIATAVSFFTENDGNFPLLDRFGMFIRPQHRKQYKEMLTALKDELASTTSGSPVNTSQT